MPFYNHEEHDQLKSVTACAAEINPVNKIFKSYRYTLNHQVMFKKEYSRTSQP